MMMLSLPAVIKVCHVGRNEGSGLNQAKGGSGGLGGNRAVDRRPGTGVEQSLLPHLEIRHPKSFSFYMSPPTIYVQNLM